MFENILVEIYNALLINKRIKTWHGKHPSYYKLPGKEKLYQNKRIHFTILIIEKSYLTKSNVIMTSNITILLINEKNSTNSIDSIM